MARGFGIFLTGTGVLGVFLLLGSKPVGLVICTTVLAVYLAGFLSGPSRTGILAGLGAAAFWVLPLLISPPVPGSSGWAFAAVAFGVIAGATLARDKVDAALTAGAIGALVIVHLAMLMVTLGPASWVPELVPAALTPADRLSNSRIEAQDPYVAVFVIGGLLAAALAVRQVGLRVSRAQTNLG
jgi:hypothetical protein